MNLICVLVVCVVMQTYGDFMFNIYELPAWAAGRGHDDIVLNAVDNATLHLNATLNEV